jgi:hypothetical protein
VLGGDQRQRIEPGTTATSENDAFHKRGRTSDERGLIHGIKILKQRQSGQAASLYRIREKQKPPNFHSTNVRKKLNHLQPFLFFKDSQAIFEGGAAQLQL